MTAMSRIPTLDRLPPVEMNGQTVGRYLVTSVPVARSRESAGEARARLIGQRFDDASHVFVLAEDGRLIGVVAIRDLLGAPETTPLHDIARTAEAYSVPLGADREAAASVAIHSGLSILAVCDAEGRFLGAVPARALMTILRDEHLEDLHHMVGILGKSEAARDALTAAPHRRALYRLPWLLVGMAGSAAATAMMSRFETALSAHIAVAFFIPAIVYLADSVGTQSEVVVIRGLSLTDFGLAAAFRRRARHRGAARRDARRSRFSDRLVLLFERRPRRDRRNFAGGREHHRHDVRISHALVVCKARL